MGVFALRSWQGTTNARLGAVVGVVTLASLAHSIIYTAENSAAAYFVTPTRVWEFGIGGLAALFLSNLSLPRWSRAALSWGGLGAIGASALLLDPTTPFPGYIALLPTLGTAAVIVAGDANRWWSPSPLANLRPVQVLGDISYSVYLWHWPLIVLVPMLMSGVGSAVSFPMRLLVIAVTLALAWLTKKYVEDRFRGGSRPTRSRRVLALVAASMLIVSAVGGLAFGMSEARAAQARTDLAAFESTGVAEQGAIYPDPVLAGTDVIGRECQQDLQSSEVLKCRFGESSGITASVALVGDSHANHWLPTLLRIAEERRWSVTTYVKSNCPFTQATVKAQSCEAWNDAVSEELASVEYDIVFVSQFGGTNVIAGSQEGAQDRAVEGLLRAWRGVTSPVVAIADIPRPALGGIADPPSCVDSKSDCSFSLNGALPDDPAVRAATISTTPLLDLADNFCVDGICPSVRDGILIYRDNDHMTAVFARSLAPEFEAQLRSLGLEP